MPATYTAIQLDVAAPLATITLNRPEAMNAITLSMLTELAAAFDEIGGHDDVRVIVLTGQGRAFSAGVDLKALGNLELVGGKIGDLLDIPGRAVISRIQAARAVVVAQVNGFCFTGALELALACDVIIAADEAVFGDTHAKWGLRPTWGMSQRLPRLVGMARARQLSYTASTFTGAQAAQWGLAAEAVPRAELAAAVETFVTTVSANSYQSLLAYKDLYRAAEQLPLAEGLQFEAGSDYPITDTDGRIAGFR
ncbi:MAG: putative enoyl-CoA hydratase [Frankiales bacterium]|nr:putative enoyl-CoA hydratase [Frankiales bacterium]